MISTLDATDHSIDLAMLVLAKAFNPNGRRRREAMRVINLVLKLAKSRGFDQVDEFTTFFRQSETEQSPKVLRRLLKHLFEFVSPDEFAQLSIGFTR